MSYGKSQVIYTLITTGTKNRGRPERFIFAMLVLFSPMVCFGEGPVPEHIKIPEGFRIELVAGGDVTRHPMIATFDDRGRLYVAEAAGVNMNAEGLEASLPNQVRQLVDTDGDGVFDKATVFADKMTFPQGAAWYNGALYVASPPSVWRLEDTDDDGVADVREEIATGFGYTGNAASVHGPFMHPDGRLYWCHGRKTHEVYQHDGALVSKNFGARIWSSNPDGSDIQVLAGGGMDNPSGLTFTGTGDVLGTVNLFYGRPRVDALAHWVYGGAYPRYDMPAALVSLKRTGPLLGLVVNLGHVAPSGLTRYRDEGLGAEYRDNVFLVEFNTHRLLRIEMREEGSSFGGAPSEFVTSDETDVHFTNVLQDADGSLLLIDTGGWFRQGCPTSRIAKPDVHGAIYRITREGSPSVKDARGLSLKWEGASAKALAGRLDDARFAVRDRALSELGRRGDEAVGALSGVLKQGSARARRNAVWALTRIGTDKAQAVGREALGDADASVRQVACHSVFTTRDGGAAGKLASLVVGDESAAVRRVAAQALGRVGGEREDGVVGALLDTLKQPVNAGDRKLEHALIYALIEINAPGATMAGLLSDHPRVIGGALVAMDQMDSGSLRAGDVLGLTRHSDGGVAEAALEIVARREEWSGEVDREMQRILGLSPWSEREAAAIGVLLGASLDNGSVAEAVGQALGDKGRAVEERARLLGVLAGVGGKLHASWVGPIRQALGSGDAGMASEAIAAAGALEGKDFDVALGTIADDGGRPSVVRIAAMRAGRGWGTLSDKSFAFLIRIFDSKGSVSDRLEAARLLGASKLSGSQLLGAIERLRTAGPLEVQALSQVITKSRDAAVGLAALKALEQSPGLYGLNANDFRKLFLRYPPEVEVASVGLFRRLMSRTYEKENRLAALEAATLKGDVARGAAAFASGVGTCNVCHEVKGVGGKVGPSLSNIGAIRSHRELLEAIAFPSDSFARDYETYLVTTRDGGARLGTVSRETAEEVYVMDVAGQEVAISRDEIASMVPSPVSLMPPGLDLALPAETLADLMAYLRSLK